MCPSYPASPRAMRDSESRCGSNLQIGVKPSWTKVSSADAQLTPLPESGNRWSFLAPELSSGLSMQHDGGNSCLIHITSQKTSQLGCRHCSTFLQLRKHKGSKNREVTQLALCHTRAGSSAEVYSVCTAPTLSFSTKLLLNMCLHGQMDKWTDRWITFHVREPKTPTQGLTTLRPGQTHQCTQRSSFSFYEVFAAQRACPGNESSSCQGKKETALEWKITTACQAPGVLMVFVVQQMVSRMWPPEVHNRQLTKASSAWAARTPTADPCLRAWYSAAAVARGDWWSSPSEPLGG